MRNYKDILKKEGTSLKEIAIFALIDSESIEEVLADMGIEMEYEDIATMKDELYNIIQEM